MSQPKKERNEKLIKLRNEDPGTWTFEALGEEFNITRITAFKIYKNYRENGATANISTRK